MRNAVTTLALLLAVGCGGGGGGGDNIDAAASRAEAFEQSMDATMRAMDEPDRAAFCEASVEEGRTRTLAALRSGWEASTPEPFYDDVAAEVVWEWCDEIEADSPAAW